MMLMIFVVTASRDHERGHVVVPMSPKRIRLSAEHVRDEHVVTQ